MDNILVTSNNTSFIDSVIGFLNKRYGVRVIEGIDLYLGIKCAFDSGAKTVCMTQPHVIEKLIELLQTQSLKPVPTPANPNHILAHEGSNCVDITNYHSAIGTLLWLAHCTHPNILFQVILLFQFQKDPCIEHWGAIKHLVRYLMGTLNLGIIVNRDNDSSFTMMTDSSFGDIQLDCKSASGCVVFLSGTPVVFSSNKQKCIATSSAEAEYIVLSDGMKKLMWIINLVNKLNTLGFNYSPVPTVFTDSQPVIALVKKNDPENSCLRHIDIHCHWILEFFHSGHVHIDYIKTDYNIADILTKLFKSSGRFKWLRSFIAD